MTTLKKKIAVAALSLSSIAGVTGIANTVDAAGTWKPISGSTTWDSPCSFFTSSNLRYVSAGGSTIRVNLSDTGKLGVKFRVKFENTGLTSTIAYIPPINTAQTLTSTQSAGTPFRTQYSCVNGRSFPDQPSTSFSGSLFY